MNRILVQGRLFAPLCDAGKFKEWQITALGTLHERFRAGPQEADRKKGI
jgi:hypothetical protein